MFAPLTLVAAVVITVQPKPLVYELSQRERGVDTARQQPFAGTEQLVMFDLRSAHGIGRATIKPLQNKWSKTVRVRLHLKGMEQLQVDNGKVMIATHVNDAALGKNEHAEVREMPERLGEEPGSDKANATRNKPKVIGPDDPQFIRVTMKHDQPDRKPSLPWDGYFELEIPPALLKGDTAEVRISWIDFYR